MREAYRLHKHHLAANLGIHFLIGYIHIGPARVCDSKTIQEKVVASLHYLNKLHTQRKDQHDPA
jgi:hypothetical protein